MGRGKGAAEGAARGRGEASHHRGVLELLVVGRVEGGAHDAQPLEQRVLDPLPRLELGALGRALGGRR